MSAQLSETNGTYNPLALIQSAIDKGMDPDKLGKLMDLQERWEKNRAAEEFAIAVSQFQAKCPTILKSRKAILPGKFDYQYASYDNVMKQASPILAECGLAVSYSTKPAPNGIEMTCRVRKGIHFEETTLTAPIPAGVVNDTQRCAMALTYMKRYALCLALNIVVTDEDDDGASALETITPEEKKEIFSLIDECAQLGNPIDIPRFVEWLQISTLNELPRNQFLKVIHELNRQRKKVVKK